MKKRISHLVLTFFAALAFTTNVFAQDIVRGTLRSSVTGEPLSGASVTIRGTNTSVITNTNGEFSINAPAGSVLVVSYVGYTSQEVTVTGTGPLNLDLQTANQELTQVIVIGYQTFTQSIALQFRIPHS